MLPSRYSVHSTFSLLKHAKQFASVLPVVSEADDRVAIARGNVVEIYRGPMGFGQESDYCPTSCPDLVVVQCNPDSMIGTQPLDSKDACLWARWGRHVYDGSA